MMGRSQKGRRHFFTSNLSSVSMVKATQDIQDRKHPPLYIDDDEDDVKDYDGYVPWNSNSNFKKATDELDRL